MTRRSAETRLDLEPDVDLFCGTGVESSPLKVPLADSTISGGCRLGPSNATGKFSLNRLKTGNDNR
jgi:hypothetical protein